jgi:hypothetical protein
MSKSAKILISLALAIGGFLSMGIGFAAHIPHPYNTILFLPGFTFIPPGIILPVFASISKRKSY